MERENTPWISLGAIIISLGAAIIGYYSFRSRLLPAFFGVLLVDIGYTVSQLENREEVLGLLRISREQIDLDKIVSWYGLVLGSLLVAQDS